MITVATLRAGNKYSADYVMKLKRAVERHITVPHNFICLTDDPGSVDCNTLPIPLNLPGWWGKLAFFSDLINERILFFDLDTVIVGNIDCFANYRGNLAIIQPFYRDTGFASGVLNIGPRAHLHIWERFKADPAAAIHFCQENADPPWNSGDQRWIELNIETADYWQSLLPGQLVSYKVHCQTGIPKNARIICFHGKPDPHEVDDPWIKDHWK